MRPATTEKRRQREGSIEPRKERTLWWARTEGLRITSTERKLQGEATSRNRTDWHQHPSTGRVSHRAVRSQRLVWQRLGK